MQLDPHKKLIFSPEIKTTNVSPDLIWCPTSQRFLCIVQLTVLWEAAVGEAYKRKRFKFAHS